MEFLTEQEDFWAGDFGTEYINRNAGSSLLASNLAFFSRILRYSQGISDCIEFGANIGMNLKALKLIYPDQQQYAIEINAVAVAKLAQVIPPENVFHTSILNFVPRRSYDLALIKGVLIHINPSFLTKVYDILHKSTGRYLLICEYYNPDPIQIAYRGHNNRLYKRDFCGEIMDLYSDFHLVDYGFIYHRDPNFPQDDITWFLLEKRA